MAKVVVLGSLNRDSVIRVHRHPLPGETLLGWDPQKRWGGKGANQAVAAVRAGAATSMIGRVGADTDGEQYTERLASLGIDVSGIAISAGTATGQASIVLDDAGENSIIVAPGANLELTSADLGPLAALEAGDVLLVSVEVPVPVVEEAVRKSASAGARVVLNLAPFSPLAADVLELADPVIVNELEAEELAATGVTPSSLLVTLGGRGSVWGEDSAPAAKVAAPVDTTGAGDSFCGTLAAALAAGQDRSSALRSASEAAARVIEVVGAQGD